MLSEVTYGFVGFLWLTCSRLLRIKIKSLYIIWVIKITLTPSVGCRSHGYGYDDDEENNKSHTNAGAYLLPPGTGITAQRVKYPLLSLHIDRGRVLKVTIQLLPLSVSGLQ